MLVRSLGAAWLATLLIVSFAHAHPGHDHDLTPHGDWSAVDRSASTATPFAPGAPAVTAGEITAWQVNTTGATGTSPDTEIDSLINTVLADVETVAYTDDYVYVQASTVPSHSVGPFQNNSYPDDRDATYRIDRNPLEQIGAKTATGLGAIGVMVNGVPFFNPLDGFSYNDEGNWNQNAIFFRAAGFDDANGHPAPIGTGGPNGPIRPGRYHYHQTPIDLLNQIDPANTGDHHSPIIGFAFDGFPIYGPYGFANTDGTGGITQMTTGYELRDIAGRTTLPDGAPATGPGVSETLVTTGTGMNQVVVSAPLGYYVEDYEYNATLGTLDEHNGRFTVTPEYPLGTYAYFLTHEAIASLIDDAPTAYPYIIGPTYYGVVDGANGPGNTIVVPAETVVYDPTFLAGDYDNDGDRDADDIDLMFNVIELGIYIENYELTGDGQVNTADADELIENLIGTAYGDANLDGAVSLLDLNTLGGNFGLPGGWADGDFNGDDTVSLLDLNTLGLTFGFDNTTHPTPEPASLMLLLIALCSQPRRNR